jgi:hypothetical protein
MKKMILIFITIFYAQQLSAAPLSMSEFRKAQRQYVLADFKALYKKRHLWAHKAELRRRYKHVKKISHSGILNNSYHPQDKIVPEDTKQASMQTIANSNLQIIKEHQTTFPPAQEIINTPNTPNGENQNNNQNNIPGGSTIDIPSNIPQNPTQNNMIGGSNLDMPNNNTPGGSTQSNITPPTQNDIPNNNVPNSNIPTNNNQNSTPINTSQTVQNITNTTSNSIQNGTSTLTNTTPETSQEKPLEQNTPANTSQQFNTQQTRPLYANPWRRR